MSFDRAVEFVLGVEGEHSHHPLDAGGDTRFGIARNAHPELQPWPPTREQAIAFYRGRYWDWLGCDRFPAPLGLVLFDCAVNQGVGRAVRLLQASLGVTMDGAIGPETLAAAARADIGALVDDFLARRAVTYANLATFSVFGLGWSRRLFACHREALAL